MKPYQKILLILFVFLSTASHSFGQNVTLNIARRNQTLGALLPQLEQSSGMVFSYDKEILSVRTGASGQVAGSLYSVLDRILEGTNVAWSRTNDNLILLYFKDGTGRDRLPREPIKKTVSGEVRDREGNPLPGVVVTGKDATVVTDLGGKYAISVPSDSRISFECLGYEKVSHNVAGRSRIDIVLEDSFNELDESVVVGYRTVRKISLVGAVTTVDMKAKESQPISNTSQLFYSTPGLYVSQSGAQPGRDASSIKIRGVNSMNSTGGSPLVLLDGVEYDISEIAPSTIESISVLKDVSAAIYGLKAANGVILITSKRGATGRPRIEYKGKFGIQQATYLPDMVTDPILYMRMRNTAEINSGVAPSAVSYTEAQIEEYTNGLGTDPCVYPVSDWFDICLENGYFNQHSLRLTGGTDRLNYTIGLGYTDQKGVFIANDNANRFSLDLKLDAAVSSKLRVSGTFQGNARHFAEVGYGSSTVLSVIMRGLPIFPDYHEGNLYGSTWLFTPGRNNIENPRMEVEQGHTFRNYQELLSTIGLEWRILPGLTYIANGAYRKYDHFSKDFIPQMYTVNPKTGDVKNFNASAPRVKDWDALMAQITLSHRLVFEKDFGKHNFHVMLGQDWQDNDSHGFQAYNHGFNDNTLVEFDALTDQTNAKATGNASHKRLISFFGRSAYNFDDRYLAEVTLRYDGSSNLSPQNRWHLFPSFLVAWNINKESFFNVSWVDMLKLRASWGVMGSESVAPYSYQMLYKALSLNYSFGGTVQAGYAVEELTDVELGWEKTRSWNVGADFSAFKGALTIEADVFRKYTYDIIMTRKIPSYIGGLAGPKSNVGAVSNTGFELSGAWRGTAGAFHYGVNGSASYIKNKVESQNYGPLYENSNTIITTEGYPIRSYFVYEADGYFLSTEEIQNAKAVYGSVEKLRPGFIKYKNNFDDEQINEKDKIIVGNSIPEWTYSFGANIGWKFLALTAQFQGVGDVYTLPRANAAMPFNNGAGVTKDWATDSWTPENPDAKLPLLTTYTDATENFIPSTFWLRNAKYLRLKNLQLSYTLPEKLLSKLKIASAQLYVSGQNLWTLSDFNLWDPEITLTRANLYEYPNLKTYSVGLNLEF